MGKLVVNNYDYPGTSLQLGNAIAFWNKTSRLLTNRVDCKQQPLFAKYFDNY